MSGEGGELAAPSGTITLLTDFGLSDPFVGVMKGVILQRFPGAVIVDLCHGIGAQDVTAGAFWLARSYEYFSAGAVHVAVVDPGVGSARRALAVSAAGHWFVGPDNGLLTGPLRVQGARARCIDVPRLCPGRVSRTFHGRDVFAPVAAELASGRLPFTELGPSCDDPVLDALAMARNGDEPVGSVVTVDRFGNLITNLTWDDARPRPARVRIAGRELPVVGTYGEVELGELAALVNAFGTIEIAERNGDAARRLGLGRGAAVELTPG